MHAKPELVRRRRLKRQLKAALSIGVALCAGVFLACQKTASAPDAASDAAREPNNEAAPPADAAEAHARPADAGADALATVDANKADALVHVGKNPRDAAVDRREHRKGMPVPDNLLE